MLHTTVSKIANILLAKNIGACDVDNYNIVSFDIFDTLIIRNNLNKPSDLFDLINDAEFKTKRIEAEKLARAKAAKSEITLDDIYEHLPLYDSGIEIEAECSVCKSNSEMIPLFNYCRHSGKRILIISDMYLSSNVLTRILISAGYDVNGVDICVSSEYKDTKQSGKLYESVLREKHLDPGRMLHIGDNFQSDYIMAKRNGINAFLYKKDLK